MAFLSIMARLGMDATGFQAGIKQAQSASAGLSKSLNSNLKGAIAGAFGTGAIIAAAHKTIEYAGHIQDLSERLDVSTTALQEFEHAAMLTGSSLDEVASFFEKMNSARDEALAGNEQMIESFARLGVNMTALRTLRAEDIFKKIGGSVQAGNPQELIGALRGVGGKSAGALIPAFKFGLDEAAKAASVISPEDIAALDEAGDKFSLLAKVVKTQLAPALVFVADMILGLFTGFQRAGRFFGGMFGGAAAASGEAGAQSDSPVEFLRRLGRSALEGGQQALADFEAEQARNQAAARGSPESGGASDITNRRAAAEEERIAKLREQVAEKELRLLPASEQRAAVEKRIAELRKQIAAFGNQADAELTAKEEEARLKARAELADAQMQLAGLQEKQQAKADLPFDPLVNSMERMGFSFRKNDTPAMTQISKLDRINKGIADSNSKLDQVVRNTGTVAQAF